MSKKLKLDKPIRFDSEVHTMIKTQSAVAGMTFNEYVKLCMISCKSQASGKMISNDWDVYSVSNDRNLNSRSWIRNEQNKKMGMQQP